MLTQSERAQLENDYYKSVEQQLTVGIGLKAANANSETEQSVKDFYRLRMDRINLQTRQLHNILERKY